MQCTADHTIAVIEMCNIKAFSRQIATANLKIKLLKIINKPLYVQLIFYCRYENINKSFIPDANNSADQKCENDNKMSKKIKKDFSS